jgi:hypothetical protein
LRDAHTGEGTSPDEAPSVALTLAGAYHHEGKPLVQRRLLVEALVPLSLFLRVFGETTLTAFVSAEEIATRALGEGMIRLTRADAHGPSEASADVTFTGDDGRHYVLALATTFEWRGIRALTQIEGTLTRIPGDLVAPARLRLDWRALFRGV